MPAPVIPAPGQNGASSDGKFTEPELSLTKDGRAECVDWDRWSPQPSVRCFYTITIKNNGVCAVLGADLGRRQAGGRQDRGAPSSTTGSPAGGPIKSGGAVFRHELLGQVIFTLEGPFFCETRGGATGSDGLAPGEEITLTIEVVVERRPEDFLFENCAALRWDWMRDPLGSDEAVRQRLGELGYCRSRWISGHQRTRPDFGAA